MITAVILAAGESLRMGTLKTLLPYRGSTVIEEVVETHRLAGLASVLVVLGHEWARVAEVLSRADVTFIVNKNYRSGMLSSAAAAVTYMAQASPPQHVLFSLADQPAIPLAVIRSVISASEQHGDRIVIPTSGGQRGHPILLPWAQALDIPRFQGEGGLRAIRDAHPDQIFEVAVECESVLRDMDTPADYEAEIKRNLRS